MDEERLPKRLFFGDAATGSRRQGGRIRRYKYTLKSSLKHLQINPSNWEELALDRPTWKRIVEINAAIYEANCIAAAKNATPTHNRFQRVLDVNGHSGHESDLLDIFGSTEPLELHQPSSPHPHLPRPLCRQLTLTILVNHHFLPSSTNSSASSSSSSSSSSTCTTPTMAAQAGSYTPPTLTQRPTPPPLPPTTAITVRTAPVLNATAPSPHTSTWSVTCESITQRLANQRLEHQPTPTKLDSVVHTVLALSGIA
nr:unnamed protein product [Spirometra erinaceieuropaei]